MGVVVASGVAPVGYTLTVDRPVGTGVGDLLVAFIGSDGAGITLGAPAGWVAIGSTGGPGRSGAAFYRIATSGEPMNYTFSSSSTNSYRIAMVRIVGANTNAPLGSDIAWNALAGNGPATSPSRDSAGGGLQLAFINGNLISGDGTFALPATWESATRNSDSNMLMIAHRNVDAGSTGTTSWNFPSAVYSWIAGSVIIAGGGAKVLSISRAVYPRRTLRRNVRRSIISRSIPTVRTSMRTRVVVRIFGRILGGAGDNPDAMVDAFTDSFDSTGSGPVFTATLSRSATKLLSASSAPVASWEKQPQKVLGGSSRPTASLWRSATMTVRRAVAPATTLFAQNIGRLFGIPGVIDITVRLAGEIRARVRQR